MAEEDLLCLFFSVSFISFDRLARNPDEAVFGRLLIYNLVFTTGWANWLQQDATSQMALRLSDEAAFTCLYFRINAFIYLFIFLHIQPLVM